MSSSNLNTLLKQQIKDAVAVIYDEQGKTHENRYSTPEQLSKALLDLLFPAEAAHNTEVTGVVRVPTVHDEVKPASDSESTDSKKERKKRAPMSDEAKAAMKAKREATIAAKKAAPVVAEPAPAPAEAVAAPAEAAPASDGEDKDKKERKKRGPMSEEAKAAMKAKREATIAAKKAAV
jgi:hypothetical protein